MIHFYFLLPRVNVPLDLSISSFANLLVDTGSDISISKLKCRNDDAEIFLDDKVVITEITKDFTTFLGISFGTITLQPDVVLQHPFHIVPESFPIMQDRILGNDPP